MLTIQQKKEYIREKAIECQPSIKDLVFGCDVKVKIGVNVYGTSRMDNIKRFTIIGTSDHDLIGTSSYDRNRIISRDSITKIIGRPLQLADILLAIKDSEEGTSCGMNFDTDEAYIFYDDFEFSKNAKWDLTKPFEEQSDEVITFIYEILK